MSSDIIDDRMLGALHLRALDRQGFEHDPSVEHTAFQTGTVNALMDGRFDGDTTVGELLGHGDHGIGTIDRLDGEMVIVDGDAFVVAADGGIRRVPPEARTPFAVVCRFVPFVGADIDDPVDWDGLMSALHDLVVDRGFAAIRVDGEFTDLRLRSVHAQTPPYPSLIEVTRHQAEWSVAAATGTVVGFRFPDGVAGIEVPGHHLHFLSDDRTSGGHVLSLQVETGRVAVDGGEELHVELPAGVELGRPGAADRAAIREAEGRG